MRNALRAIVALAAVAVTAVALAGQAGATTTPTPSTFDIGAATSCFVTSTGGVKCWGHNQNGLVGDGTTTTRLVPTDVVGVSGAIGVANGFNHNCALLANGTVKCWGLDYDAQIGRGTYTAGDTSTRYPPTQVVGITDAVDIMAGENQTCVIVAGGSVKCWGQATVNSLLDQRTATPVTVPGVTGAVDLGGALYTSCALINDGTVKCWGANNWGNLGNGTPFSGSPGPNTVIGLTDAVGIGTDHSTINCALRATGEVACWGTGFLGDGTNRLVSSPVTVSGITDAVQVEGGRNHICAIRANGSVWCWGSNEFGALGISTSTPSSLVPVQVPGLPLPAVDIAVGYLRTCVELTDASLRCWGLDYGPGNSFTAASTVAGVTLDGFAEGGAPDVTAPALTVPTGVSLQAATAAGATAAYTVTAVDAVDGPIAPVCAPAAGSLLPLGITTVSCTATDLSGNVASASFPVTVRLVAIASAPPAVSTSQQAPFAWGGISFVRTECSLDGAAFAACSSPRLYHGLAAGPHVFCVKAVADVVPACHSWTIVSPGQPVVTISGVTVSGRSATVTFTADQLAPRFSCSIDGGAFRSCSSPFRINGLALGSHTIAVRATNFAGDVSASPAVATFTVG